MGEGRGREGYQIEIESKFQGKESGFGEVEAELDQARGMQPVVGTKCKRSRVCSFPNKTAIQY